MAEAGTAPVVGIIGGSGLYDIDGLANTRWEKVFSPFGAPSDEVLIGDLDGLTLVFLPRHGRGHRIPPSELNFRANIDVLKRLGCTDILSLSACGSFKEELAPGTFVVVDQFIDRTFARVKSFFVTGLVAHVGFGDPVCARLGDALYDGAKELGIDVVRGGTYLVMEGPQFSTKAESNLYRSWGCDVIGMTNMRSQTRARSRDVLRDRRHGDRLRLLASRPRPRDGRRHRRGAAQQCRQGQGTREERGAAAGRPVGKMSARLPYRARYRDHYRARFPRSRHDREARGGRWPRARPGLMLG